MDSEPEKGQYRLRITEMDDLWYLYQIIGGGTKVGGLTYRKLEAKEDQVRASDQPRVKVYLWIEVEDVEFHPFTDALRVKGVIVEGPGDMTGHHTFNLDPGTTMEMIKENITKEEVDLIEEAEAASALPKALVLMVDDENAQLYRIREYGLESLGNARSGPGGKRYEGSDKWESLFKEIEELIVINHSEGIPLLIAGPGFFKERVSKRLREAGISRPEDIHLITSSSSGLSGLREALVKGDGMGKVIEDMRFARELNLMEELMGRIGKGTLAAYGLDEVKRALDIGAVETLLITEEMFRTPEGKELLEKCGDMGSAHYLISSSHDGGKMLDKLGGAGALLRFRI